MQAVGAERIETDRFTLAIRISPPAVEVLEQMFVPVEFNPHRHDHERRQMRRARAPEGHGRDSRRHWNRPQADARHQMSHCFRHHQAGGVEGRGDVRRLSSGPEERDVLKIAESWLAWVRAEP
jgi:hypothetical protein